MTEALETEPAQTRSASRCVHEAVEAQARRTPHAVALVHGGAHLTYRELDARANQVARLLRRHGVGPEVLVGVYMARSPELVVAMLGVLKAGGAYVPLDPAYPRARVELMLADTRVPVLLTQPALAGQVDAGDAAVVALDGGWSALAGESAEPVESGAHPEGLSHVIYTSGSTGRPKGVQIRHASVTALIRWASKPLAIEEGTRVLASTSVCFDVHVAETWMPLSLGARVVLVANALELASLPADEPVEVASMVPSAAAELLRMGAIPPCVRSLNLGGEPLRNELAQALYALPTVERVLNLYGPTEDTTYSTWHLAERGATRAMPVGRTVDGTTARLLDDALAPVADGDVGEVWLAGDGLARGYLRRPAATAERFVPDPFGAPGARMYRTGDLGRVADDGVLECLGRVDHQVKVRGYRVELGEVEEALRRHPAVSDAAAAVRDDGAGGPLLVGYAVPVDGAAPAASELKACVRERLPEYMVPSFVVILPALPRLPNGKVDCGALPAPAADASRPYAPPRTPAEEAVCRIWEEVLGAERVGVDDDFFELGGHSLRATQVASRIRLALGAELPLRAVFEARTPAELAAAAAAASVSPDEASIRPPLVRVPRDRPLPLSASQQAIWFFQELSPGMKSYNFQATIELDGRVDVPALERALTELVRRHEIFRTTFASVDGEPRQEVRDPWPVPLPVTDLRGLEDTAREAELGRLLRDEFQRPFDLGQLPLIRWILYRTGDDQHVLASVEHHFVHDGWSYGVYLRELAALYSALCRGRDPALPEPQVQFADYAAWQQAWMRTPEAARQLAWWKETLSPLPPPLELRTDRPRPAEMSFRGRTQRFTLPPELARAAREMGRERGATLYATLLAAFQALLHRYTGQVDFAVGGGVANRNDRAAEGVIGMIVNTVALRADLAGDPTGAGLLRRVRGTVLDAYARREIPFGEVVEAVQPERSLSRLPLYQVAFSFQDVPYPPFDLPGARMRVTEALSNESAKFDLQVIVIPRGSQQAAADDEVTMIWEYATDLFDDSTVAAMERHFRTLVAGMCADPEAPVSSLPLLSEDERRTIVDEWSGHDALFPHATVDRLFAGQAALTPEAIALEWAGGGMTYAELDARANRLARRLRRAGVVAGTRVGLCLERSPDLIAASLAVLKAGGAYVPLDPAYPAERLSFILRDAAVPVVVTVSALADALPPHSAETVLVDGEAHALAAESSDAPEAGTSPESAAYVMYTSGSTGTPKGVEIPHRGVVRLARGGDHLPVRPDDVFLHFAPGAFDAAPLETWPALLNGARVVLYPPEPPSVEGIEAAVRAHGVTVLWLTAGLFHLLVDTRIGALRGVRHLLSGGDVLSPERVRRVLAELPETAFTNGYGPTENTTFTTCHRVDALSEGAPVPIGRPIANTRVYVLDTHLRPVAPGIPGELYTGGAGLALGYLNRPGLTAAAFIPSPFRAGERLYRTGDLACWRADGVLDFLGRVDAQVKIRGFRVEPGEVETMLRAHPAVTDARVVARSDGGEPKRLVAYVVSAGDADEDAIAAIRAHLRARLPEHMVPSAVVTLDALPLSANGKVDDRALPAPQAVRAAAPEGEREPRDETERALAEVLASVLALGTVGIHDNFFELGGDSILSLKVVSRAREAGVPLTTRDVFHRQTVAAMAAEVRGRAPEWAPAPNAAVAELDGDALDELLYALEEGEPA